MRLWHSLISYLPVESERQTETEGGRECEDAPMASLLSHFLLPFAYPSLLFHPDGMC